MSLETKNLVKICVGKKAERESEREGGGDRERAEYIN
jgi:hypothetical protein